ncbi:hypothetical protein FBU31_007611 [Coemansia sp. 'formosensis']|nr:hypothetical protein FBU31_007611 [Coemansia sp. 'formosensis']
MGCRRPLGIAAVGRVEEGFIASWRCERIAQGFSATNFAPPLAGNPALVCGPGAASLDVSVLAPVVAAPAGLRLTRRSPPPCALPGFPTRAVSTASLLLPRVGVAPMGGARTVGRNTAFLAMLLPPRPAAPPPRPAPVMRSAVSVLRPLPVCRTMP